MLNIDDLVNQIIFRNLIKQPNNVIEILHQHKIIAKKCICSNNKFKIKQIYKTSQQAIQALNTLKQTISDIFKSHVKNIKTYVRPDLIVGTYAVIIVIFEIN